VIIFLDIDGVLRRKQSPLYRFDADCLRTFEQAVRSVPDSQIVITSSWREAFTLNDMRAMFSPDIRLRILGVTPVAPNQDGHYRYREVLAYLKFNGREKNHWLAIDDDPLHYPPLKNVLLIDGERGFDSTAAKRLTIQIADNCLNKNH
jgi:hypothetical protein